MKHYISILISILLFSSNLSAQNRIMSYGCFFGDWVEFHFYDDNSYKHIIYNENSYIHIIKGGTGLGHTTTEGKYTTQGDTIILLDKIQRTYNFGNRSSKFLKSGDTLLVDLDILWGYAKLENFTSLKQKERELKDSTERVAFFSTHFADIQQIKFPYQPLEDEAQIKDVNIVMQDFFNQKIVSDFVANNSTILVRFFYKVDHILKISVPQKVIEFIEYKIEKIRNPKRIQFYRFYILEDHKTIFFYVTLHGGQHGKLKDYSVEYKKENESWTLNYIRKER